MKICFSLMIIKHEAFKQDYQLTVLIISQCLSSSSNRKIFLKFLIKLTNFHSCCSFNSREESLLRLMENFSVCRDHQREILWTNTRFDLNFECDVSWKNFKSFPITYGVKTLENLKKMQSFYFHNPLKVFLEVTSTLFFWWHFSLLEIL